MEGYEVIRSIAPFNKVVHDTLFDLPLFSFFYCSAAFYSRRTVKWTLFAFLW